LWLGSATPPASDSPHHPSGGIISPRRTQPPADRYDPSRVESAILGQQSAFQLDEFDDGRLVVNRPYVETLRRNELLTFDELFAFAGGDVIRQIKSRSTTRIVLQMDGHQHAFYLKRHEAPNWRERLRPLLNFAKPILGARNEWEALLRFHAAGIPTMTPVAFGVKQGRSLLVTEDLGTDRTVLDWVNERAALSEVAADRQASNDEPLKRSLIKWLADMARQMHDMGAHHQDFYLNHILWRGAPENLDLRVIDLGRVGFSKHLSQRWILKDLAQLNYSARELSCADRLRFLRLYLGRPFSRADRRLVRLIAMKSRHIASHTLKHRL
jgi:heptose I phosphotransferase